MTPQDIQKLAEEHGLVLEANMSFNEMGIDFKVAFVTDFNGVKWVLRIPRRDNLSDKIQKERKILDLAKKHLSIAVPDWKIVSPRLIAYPLLEEKPVLTFDANTYEVTWNMAQDAPDFVSSLANVLYDLHRIPISEVATAGLKILSAADLREEIASRIDTVKSELGIGKDLESRWRRWVDNEDLWPDYTKFIHGDLYAGHILASTAGNVTGVIDWSEGQVSDPSIDFSGHVAIFGEESLKALIGAYEKLGGIVYDKFFEQVVERQAASPLNYGIFAIEAQSEAHIQAAKAQLGVA